MRALLDVSVLLALFDETSGHHAVARRWWAAHRRMGWASSPLTENGFHRIAAQASYPGRVPLGQARALFMMQREASDHALWPDDISIVDDRHFDWTRILGPGQITDVYLLALAVRNGGRLVTFDRGIPLAAAIGAEPRHLVVI